jgi:hypothetical protein
VGVVLSLLFLMWFASGAVLSFVPFPAIGDHDRLAMSPVLQADSVKVAPAAALALAGGETLDLVAWPDRAVYVVGRDGAPFKAVDASTGRLLPQVDAAQASRIAAVAGRSPVKAVSAPIDYDQWVVHPGFDSERPLYRVRLADAAQTDLYVSSRSGRVVQRTRFDERAWNWTGAVLHWIYFTALRKSQAAWDQTVWWISLAGVAVAAMGLYLGGHRTVAGLSRRRPNWSPFHGWLRWHHGVGLGVGVFVFTWIVSGWLSMDHGRLFSRGRPSAEAAARYEGRPLVEVLQGVPASALAGLLPARQLVFAAVGGHAIASAEGGSNFNQVLDLTAGGPVRAQLDPVFLVQSVARGWPIAHAGPTAPPAFDDLYRAAEEAPDRAVSFHLTAPRGSYLYLDPVSGRLLTLMDPSRQAYAWAYYALHTFKFPGLVGQPVLRRIIEFVPLMLGLAFSLTGVVISLQRIGLWRRR